MTTDENFFSESKQKVEEYVKDRLLLLKLEAVEKISRVAGSLFAGLLIALFSFFLIMFLSIMLGYFLGELLHHMFWGFGIVAGLYLVLLVVVIVFRKHLFERPIINMMIDIFFEKKKEQPAPETENLKEAAKVETNEQ